MRTTLATLLSLALAPGAARAQLPGLGVLDALTRPRASRIVHYASTDPRRENGDARAIAPGDSLVLLDHRGAGIVRRWWVTIAPRNDRAIQRQLIVRCWWDDEPTPSVEVPVSDFFGVGFGEWVQYVSRASSMTSGGYDSYWPMPFRRRARIVVENRSAVRVDAFYYNVDVEAVDSLPSDALYFHAQFRRTTTVAGQPVTLLEATGRGLYVGTLLSMQPRFGRRLWFLEGNERVFVDGERSPSIEGTGTEDYFSSGWYFDTGPYSSPYHGLTIKDEASGRVSAYRWHIEDPIPFARSLAFTIQHGGTNDAANTDYTSVAYWYQTHPHAPFPPLPADLMPVEPWKERKVPGLVEGEALVPRARATEGAVEAQDLAWFEVEGRAWSGGKQLWWRPTRPGARLTLPLAAPAAGSYELVAHLTTAPDYGTARFSVNGRALAPTVDLYDPAVTPKSVSLGRVTLRRGDNTVVVEVTGKNAASKGYLVGIDGFALR